MLLINEEMFYTMFKKISENNQLRNVRKYGEVYTPIRIINKMLDKIPEDIWNNKNLKWFDFACGIGSFGFFIYKRLMDGLKNVIKDEKERCKHILENMIYFNEIQDKNIIILKKIFCEDKYKLNIIIGDFFNIKDLKFNIIISNPPYNKDSNRAHGHTVWAKFVDHSLTLLEQSGYALFIHPAAWRKPATANTKNTFLYKKITKDRQLLYLEIHGIKDGKQDFKCGTRYDWYILENIKKYKSTTIVDETGKIWELDLDEWIFIPNHSYDIIKQYMTNDNNKSCKILYGNNCNASSEYVSDKSDGKYKYPLIHTTTSKGTRFKYSSRNDIGFFGIKKVIWGDSGINDPVIDIYGIYGITNHSMAIQVESLEEAIKVYKCLKSNIFKLINDACMYSNYQIEWRIFLYLKHDIWDYIYNALKE